MISGGSLINDSFMLNITTLGQDVYKRQDYGVPQRRNRVIFIGYRNNLPAPSYPEPTVEAGHHLSLDVYKRQWKMCLIWKGILWMKIQ